LHRLRGLFKRPLRPDPGGRISQWTSSTPQVVFPMSMTCYTDVRDLQRQLKAQGVQLQQQADESTTGPASFIAVDPDGNPILVDQHV
jgi:hypothetical protein